MTEKQEKTKVLYIITKSVWGGAQKYVFDLATNLPQTKFMTFVAAGGHGLMAEKLKSKNIPYFEIKSFQRDVSFLKDFFAFFEILFLLFKNKPDIVHVSSAKAGGVSGIAILLYKLSTFNFQLSAVFTAHGWTFNEARPQWQTFLIKLFSKITCLFYEKIICVSKYDYDCAIKNKIAPERKLAMIHNGIRAEDYNFLAKKEARDALQKISNFQFPIPNEFSNPNYQLIGTIGEFTKNKGQKYLTDAINILNTKYKIQTTALIIGHGELKEELQKQINTAGLENSVFLVENLSNASNYLKAFDIFVLPSIKEGLPYVLLEAGLAGVPIIATNVGGISEIIHDTKKEIPLNLPLSGEESASDSLLDKGGLGWVCPTGILVPPADPQALAEAIKKLSDNPDLRQTLATNAHKKILKDFSLDKMLAKTIEIYLKK